MNTIRILGILWLLVITPLSVLHTQTIRAGVGKANISSTEPGTIVNDSLYVKALILEDNQKTIAIITIDVVALEKIGHVPDHYLTSVRTLLQEKFNIQPGHVLINASHCHGKPRPDVVGQTIHAVEQALQDMEPVQMGVDRGMEDRISINRRLKLTNGKERDIRHAYSLPPDEEIEGVGVIDTEIGIMCLRTLEGNMKAVMYNYACHPIQGVPSRGDRGNSAGFPGYASDLIEKVYNEGSMAFFIQGCAGDVNPVLYKNVATPRSAEIHGIMLGSTILKQISQLDYQDVKKLDYIHETIELPLADLSTTIDSLEIRKLELVNSLNGTSLNFKTFLTLYLKYHLFQQFPSFYAHQYFHEKMLGQENFLLLDQENQKLVSDYLQNIYRMEELTVVKENINLLSNHQKSYLASKDKLLHAEVNAFKMGGFVLVTFPGELSTQIGLNIKEKSPYDFTYISAYTNGYTYYAPTDEQLKNRGGAQEDSECVLGMGWQKIFEEKALEIIKSL